MSLKGYGKEFSSTTRWFWKYKEILIILEQPKNTSPLIKNFVSASRSLVRWNKNRQKFSRFEISSK